MKIKLLITGALMIGALGTNAGNPSDGLIKLNEPGWVIQVASFKNKVAAIRLVNHLRANGYHAFMQRMNTIFGESTTVFVGPEYKQAYARSLASRLESDMHIRGIVISYKPLTL